MIRLLVVLIGLSAAEVCGMEVRPLPTVCRPVAGSARTWETRHFRITSEVEVAQPDLLRLAAIADATARAVAKHPVPWFDPPRRDRAQLSILRDAASYERTGATPGTAGMYLWNQQSVVLDAGHLFPSSTGGSRLKPLPDEGLLIHEMVHLCLHGSHGHLPHWFAEGVCEYFAAAHQGAGVFRFDTMDRGIRDYLRRRFGPTRDVIPALPVASILELDPREWLSFMLKLPAEQRPHGYVTALLLAHYHLHAAGRRDEVIRAFSSKPPTVPPEFKELADASTPVEKRLTDYWHPRGVKIRFAGPLPAPPSPASRPPR